MEGIQPGKVRDAKCDDCRHNRSPDSDYQLSGNRSVPPDAPDLSTSEDAEGQESSSSEEAKGRVSSSSEEERGRALNR